MSSVIDVKSGNVDAIVVINNESTSTSIGLLKDSVPKSSSESPRIIGNDLVMKSQTAPAFDRLDELSSLEREIAKLHHVEESHEILDIPGAVNSVSSKFYTDQNDINLNTEMDERNSKEAKFKVKKCANLDPIASGETSLDHEDLIAVLKGLDESFSAIDDAELLEGVTIEGEGEYQIMEVVDDECTPLEEKPTLSVPVGNAGSPTKSFGAVLLTTEAERALALEQMECLKSKSRRRKQDMKPIKQSDSVMDLVSALEAEWTDTDEDAKEAAKAKNLAEKNAIKSDLTKKRDIKSPLVTSVVVLPTLGQNSTSPVSTEEANNDIITSTESSEIIPKEAAAANSSPDGVIETKTEESHIIATTTGFRRTRVIKRKIIWDPDAPETTFSYANLVTSSKPKIKQETAPTPNSTIKKGNTTIRAVKKDVTPNVQKKIQRPGTPRDKKLIADTNASLEKKAGANKNELEIKVPPKSVDNSFNPVTVVSAAGKKRSQTPVTNGAGCAKKKKVTELDRLMGDEGAINMLNSLEKLESSLGPSENKPTRPMMRSRAATICDKSAIRKDSPSPIKTPPPTTNQQVNIKGKRSGKSRASSSWDYVYQQKQKSLDDSMIIRRRSNSSYSSNASVNRLSIDGPTGPLNISAGSTSKFNDKTLSPPPEDISKLVERSTINDNKSAGAGTKTISTSPSGGKSFEFAKPENKKAQRRTKSPGGTFANDLKKPSGGANKRLARSVSNVNEEVSEISPTNRSPTNANSISKERTPMSDVIVKKSSKVTQIIFSTNKAKISHTFTTQMLNKLADILEKLTTDPDTYVTVITTNDSNFCQGVDLAELVASGSAEKRKIAVKNLSTAVKKYLKTLATFPKPLIVAVKGHVMNLGVMQLALFDVVVAADKCTYETPYVKMGQVPEGYSLWTSVNKIRGSFKTKLFWLSEKVQSTEAALAGLVNKLTISSKVNEEAVLIARKIAALSPEAYRVMKKTTSAPHLEVLETLFEEEFITIAEQWSSAEFMGNIKNYLEQGHF